MAFDVDKARETLRRRGEERRKNLDELADRAEREALRIIEMLIREFHPARI